MSYRGTSSSASGSPSPSSENPSLTASPATYTLLMSQGPEEADPSKQSPHRSPSMRSGRSDLVRAQSMSSAGGCWTCRIRRKKCDEQREGDSCATCLRLKLKCLGWGPRRPEWMKDKQAVKQYKEDIKAQLARQGMIRGIPRAAASTPSTPSGLSHNLEPSIFDLSPRSAGLVAANEYGYQYEEAQGLHPADYGYTNVEPDMSTLGIYEDPAIVGMGASSSTLFLPTSEHTSMVSRPDMTMYAMYPPHSESQAGNLSSYNLPATTAVEGDHIVYYFHHVQKLQYCFSDNRLTDALYAAILHEPHGSVTNAVCAMANLHFTNARVVQGLEPENADPQATLAMKFYNQAYYQIAQSKHTHGNYLLRDAVAAITLAMFSLFTKTSTDWTSMVEVACDWLGQNDIFLAESPGTSLMNMDYLGQFAAKATMWLDIFSSVTLMQPPRYLSLYRRLFGSASNSWPGVSGASQDERSLGMEALTGCPDDVLLAIAEISALAHWKAQELRRGSLSVRELVRRGDIIEEQWLQRSRAAVAPEPGQPRPGSSRIPSPLATTSFPASSLPPSSSVYGQDFRGLVAELFREAAILYLHITLNDCNPGIPEIFDSVNYILQIVQRIPPSDIDRSIIFPLFLAACVSDDRNRDLFRTRFAGQEAGCLHCAARLRLVLESIWKERDTSRSMAPVHWRDVMRDLGFSLLLA